MFKHVQAHSILAQRRSCTPKAHSSVFNHIHTRSKVFMPTQFHVESVVKWVQSHSDSLKGSLAHSSTFNRIQCSCKGVHMHSECIQVRSRRFNTRSKAFTHTQCAFKCIQSGSVVVTLTQRAFSPVRQLKAQWICD